MEIQQDSVVTIHYVLRGDDGEVVDQSDGQPLSYLHGHSNLIPGLEKSLDGHEPGDEVETTVTPEEGYGQYNEDLVQNVSRDAFEGVDNLEVGMSFRAESDAGNMIVTIKEVGDEQVTVDGNHVLAGQNLNFVVTVADVRQATSDEIEQGDIAEAAANDSE
ncbi:peptidylprolyl isomerase [Salinisphaera sp. USBA-960]|uniref:FKBP-type peptidyl-prolyl cis-trans isomerase n=1 Tax=Salinisphaera orenii TaxID=856731 RepID=UPI000DBE6234|nr:peptidylprolyl isomerase [Salifodinibacter halophilus]NNC25687.1 peptidylprolyl isomerase [Salifodinibacter halophilus]